MSCLTRRFTSQYFEIDIQLISAIEITTNRFTALKNSVHTLLPYPQPD
jgi:hypothetical protein